MNCEICTKYSDEDLRDMFKIIRNKFLYVFQNTSVCLKLYRVDCNLYEAISQLVTCSLVEQGFGCCDLPDPQALLNRYKKKNNLMLQLLI